MVTVRSCTQPLPSGKSKNPMGSATLPPAAGDVESTAKVPVGVPGGAGGDMPSAPQDSISPEARKRARAFRVMCTSAAACRTADPSLSRIGWVGRPHIRGPPGRPCRRPATTPRGKDASAPVTPKPSQALVRRILERGKDRSSRPHSPRSEAVTTGTSCRNGRIVQPICRPLRHSADRWRAFPRATC
jgi:hypothetical protein